MSTRPGCHGPWAALQGLHLGLLAPLSLPHPCLAPLPCCPAFLPSLGSWGRALDEERAGLCRHRCMPYALCPQNMPVLCPPEYMVCFLHRLIAALRYYWDEYKKSNPNTSVSEGE